MDGHMQSPYNFHWFLPYQLANLTDNNPFSSGHEKSSEPLDFSKSTGSIWNAPEKTSKPTSDTIFKCDICGKQYRSNCQYRAHIRRHQYKRSGRYQCGLCKKNFAQRSSLKTHEYIHTGERPYACGVCRQRFGDSSTYTKHLRTHSGEKPYACPVCDRRFSQSGNMHRHLKLHTGRPNL